MIFLWRLSFLYPCLNSSIFLCISSFLSPSVSLFAYLFPDSLSLCLSLRLSILLSISINPSLYLYQSFSLSLSLSLSISLSLSLSISLSLNYQTTSDESGLIIVWMMHNGMWYVPNLSHNFPNYRLLLFLFSSHLHIAISTIVK